MPWLKVDDRFDENRKIVGLSSDGVRWRWLRVLCWAARSGTDGFVPTSVFQHLGVGRHIAEFDNAGLLDLAGLNLWKIHDWDLYNGDVDARVQAYLRQFPQATANDVHRAVGGGREMVLRLVHQYREHGESPGTNAGPTPPLDPVPGKAGPSVSRTGAVERPSDFRIPDVLKDVP